MSPQKTKGVYAVGNMR